jgi:hypothetical protein
MRRDIIGMLVGWALWAVLYAIGYGYVTGNGFPRWLPGRIGFAAAVASMPIGFGGWVFVWGDGPGQPPAFVNSVWFSVVFGPILYGALGAMAGTIYGRLRGRGTA